MKLLLTTKVLCFHNGYKHICMYKADTYVCIYTHEDTDVKKRVCKVSVASERHFKLL